MTAAGGTITADHVAALHDGRRRHRVRLTCHRCARPFDAGDRKRKLCDDCRGTCGGCGRPSKTAGLTCRACSPRVAAALAALHEGTRRDNPARRPDVRAKIAAAMRDHHPCRDHPEQWAAHIVAITVPRVSTIEHRVADAAPWLHPQYVVAGFRFDFADVQARVLIEVNGCWWHACPACHPEGPMYPRQVATVKNDAKKRAAAREAGWTVIAWWAHEEGRRPT